MSNPTLLRRPAAAAALALTLATAPALALDPTGDPVADAFLRIVEAQSDGDVSAAGASTDGDVTTIDGFAATTTDEGQTVSMTSRTVAITGGIVSTEGGLTADAVAFDGLRIEGSPEPFLMTVGTIEAEGVALAPPGQADDAVMPGDDATYERLVMQDIVLSDGVGDDAVTVARFSTEGRNLASDTLREGELTLERAVIPVAGIEDEQLKANLEALGYREIALDVSLDGTWAPQSGDLDLRTVRVTGADMGTVSFSGQMGGLTEELVARLQQDGDDQDELMGRLTTEVTVSSLELTYEDGSLVEKILRMVAEAQGTTADAFADQLGQMLPQMLSAIGNEAFESEVASAVGAFLRNPRSITLTADPANAVPIAQVLGAAMMSPGAIPTVLGVTVSANR